MPRGVDQVVFVSDLANEISDTIFDVTIQEWQRSLALLNLSFEPLQILTVRVQRPEVVLERMHKAIACQGRITEPT